MNDYPRLSDAKLENLLEDADFQSAAHVWTENFP
jgi:hypothetical protein